MARVIRANVVEAHDEAARIKQAAREEMEREREELRAELAREARAELAAAYLELDRARERMELETERAIVLLAVAIARKIVGEELAAKPEHVRALVREALDRVRRAERVRVRVHPDDASVVRDLGVEIVEDATIERGGCIVESELGDIDARLAVRLDALARALAKTPT